MLRAFLVALTFAWGISSASDLPRSVPLKDSQLKQAHPTNAGGEGAADNRETKKSTPVVESAPDQSTQTHSNAKPTKSDEKPHEEDRTLEIIFIGLTAVATVVLAISTIALSCSTKRLWQEAKAASRIALRSAQAANTSAKATMLAERAYVKMSHVSPGVRWIEGNKELFEIEVEVKNHGRTPTNVTDVRIAAKLMENGELLPKQFPYPAGEHESIPNAFLVTNETFFHTKHFPLRGQDLADAKSGAKKLWIFGHVDYIDTFKTRHRAGYVRVYIPHVDDGKQNNLFYMTEARYNYDRPRKQGEGNDWDEYSPV